MIKRSALLIQLLANLAMSLLRFIIKHMEGGRSAMDPYRRVPSLQVI
jgi:hypothetical protein